MLNGLIALVHPDQALHVIELAFIHVPLFRGENWYKVMDQSLV